MLGKYFLFFQLYFVCVDVCLLKIDSRGTSHALCVCVCTHPGCFSNSIGSPGGRKKKKRLPPRQPNVIALLPLDCAGRRPAVTTSYSFPSPSVCGNRPPLSSSSPFSRCIHHILNNLFFSSREKIQPPFVFIRVSTGCIIM